jgi:hypothetical protein
MKWNMTVRQVRILCQIVLALILPARILVTFINSTILITTVQVNNKVSFTISTTNQLKDKNRSLIDEIPSVTPSITVPQLESIHDVVVYDMSHIDPTLSQQAYDFVMHRREYYETRGLLKRWRMRGVGYLYYYWNMILLATIPQEQIQYGRNVVTIQNIMNLNDKRYPTSTYIEKNGMRHINCSLWTLYVRVNGPEIFAGSAEAVTIPDSTRNNNCYWEFPFNLSVLGIYIVDVKALYYNATSIMESPCIIYNDTAVSPKTTKNPYYDKTYYHQGFKGFKLYSPAEMCCEVCSRLSSDCLYWSTPPLGLAEPYLANNGCELYFRDNTSEWIPESMFVNNSNSNLRRRQRRRHLQSLVVHDYHGPPNGNRDLYFIGCGWSFWMALDFPCLDGDLDDRIYVTNDISIFIFTETDKTNNAPAIHPYSTLPLCTLNMEQEGMHHGRWVRAPWPNDTVCPNKMETDPDFNQKFAIMKYDPQNPHCNRRDDLRLVGHNCIEMNCRFIPESSKWTTSSLHLEKRWYGRYQQYQCRYQEFTDEELQICINERKIHTINGSGRSIWDFLQLYLKQRIQNLVLYNKTKSKDGIKIHLSTLSLLHLRAIKMQEHCESLPVIDTNHIEYYWVNGLYTSSEREHEARGPTLRLKSQIANDILGPKHYRMINFYDMTTAFTYDTATQFDGMHIIGPPMKMVITKLFHYMCYNTSVSQR